MWRFGILALVMACGGSTADNGDDGGNDTETDMVGDSGDTDDTGAEECQITPPDGETDCRNDIPAGTKLVGTLLDVNGGKLGKEAFRVQFCRGTTCLTPNCSYDNTFGFGGLEAGGGSFDVVPTCPEERFATPFAPISVEDGKTRTIDVVVPRLDAAQTLGDSAAEIEVTDGVFLTTKRGDISSPLDPNPGEISGVDATDITVPIEGVPGTIKAVYYLAPFDYKVDPPAPLRIDNDFGLTADNGEIWYADYFHFKWEKLGDTMIDGDSKLTTTNGLPLMTTIVVVEKEAK